MYVAENPRKEASRKYYLKNKDKVLAQRRERRAEISASNRTRRAEVQQRVRKVKEVTPCADCERSYPWYVMDFDHITGKKIANVAKLVSNGYSWEVVKIEIDKCEVVCSNCHRERTHGLDRSV